MIEEGSGRPSVDPKDPESFSFQYEVKKAAAILRNKLFAEESIRQTFASETRIEALQDAVTRGKDAHRLLSGEFWARDVEPFLKAEAVLKPWNPKEDGIFTFMKLVSTYIFGSGQARVIIRLMETLHRWEREGDAAEKILLGEADKRKRASAVKAGG